MITCSGKVLEKEEKKRDKVIKAERSELKMYK